FLAPHRPETRAVAGGGAEMCLGTVKLGPCAALVTLTAPAAPARRRRLTTPDLCGFWQPATGNASFVGTCCTAGIRKPRNDLSTASPTPLSPSAGDKVRASRSEHLSK